MRRIAAVTEASVTQRILESLALPPLALAEAIDLGPDPNDRAIEGTFVEWQEDPGWELDRSADEVPVENDGSRPAWPDPGTHRRVGSVGGGLLCPR